MRFAPAALNSPRAFTRRLFEGAFVTNDKNGRSEKHPPTRRRPDYTFSLQTFPAKRETAPKHNRSAPGSRAAKRVNPERSSEQKNSGRRRSRQRGTVKTRSEKKGRRRREGDNQPNKQRYGKEKPADRMPEKEPAKKTFILGVRGAGRAKDRAKAAERKISLGRRAAVVKSVGIVGENGVQTRSAHSRQTKDEHQQPEAQTADLPHHSPRHETQLSGGYSPAGRSVLTMADLRTHTTLFPPELPSSLTSLFGSHLFFSNC